MKLRCEYNEYIHKQNSLRAPLHTRSLQLAIRNRRSIGCYVATCNIQTNGQFSVEFPRGIMSALQNYIFATEMSFHCIFVVFAK